MKRSILTLITVLFALCAMAQRSALILDEGGKTNIRKGPGSNYSIVRKMDDGFGIYIGDNIGGWYEVYESCPSCYDGISPRIGYIHQSKVVVPRSTGYHMTVAQVVPEGGYTNIRKGPGTNYSIASKVKDGSYILIENNYDASWLRVFSQQGSLKGYISRNKVQYFDSVYF